MVRAELVEPTCYRVHGPEPKTSGIAIHGYGGNKEELLGLAVHLAERCNADIIVPDLPGHGSRQDTLFTRANSLEILNRIGTRFGPPDLIVGHSIGAHLGLQLNPPVAVALSMPGEAFFEGSLREMLSILRARRVRENSVYGGLREVLAVEVEPAARTLLLVAEQDIKSVKDIAETWATSGIECKVIEASNHLDIAGSPLAIDQTCDWLNGVLS